MIRISSLMRVRYVTLVLMLATLALVGPLTRIGVQADPQRDPKAVAVVDAALKAIAPEDGWSKVGGLRFTYSLVKDAKAVSVSRYVWDVHSGQCRVEWTEANGYDHIVVFNVGGKGRVGHEYLKMTASEETAPAPADAKTTTSTPAPPHRRPAAARWIEAPGLMARTTLLSTYERFVHDSYSLVMPLKLKDPGVNLGYEGEKSIGKQSYDVVKVTYEQATPGIADTYWIYVNRDTHLIDRCESSRPPAPAPETVLEGEKPETPKSPGRDLWIWKDWKPLGPVKLATHKSLEDGSASIELQGVETLSTVAETEFRSPVEIHPRPVPKKNG